GIIDEALVVKRANKEPWALPAIARTPNEIIEAMGSKYTFVSFDNIVKKLSSNSAIVGLPCQIRRYQNAYFKLGLFCGLNLSPRGIDYLLKKLGVKKEEIKALDYRAPEGGLLVELKNGSKLTYKNYSWLAYFFSYSKCLYCKDNTNHYADISVGDRKPEWCNVIIRTQNGEEIFMRAEKEGYIKINSLTKEDFLTRTMSPLFQKELRGGYINTKLVRVRGRWIEFLPLNVLRFMGNLIYYHTCGKLSTQALAKAFKKNLIYHYSKRH
ncbi:MAG: Coenzyme F420 hydrogenase/dehydrogenase, beta subunit C-terminal domain, partial [Candidatus Bathyarchaeia archaeon]